MFESSVNWFNKYFNVASDSYKFLIFMNQVKSNSQFESITWIRDFYRICDELLNILNKKGGHVWTRRGVHLNSKHEKREVLHTSKINLCVLLLPTSFVQPSYHHHQHLLIIFRYPLLHPHLFYLYCLASGNLSSSLQLYENIAQ